MMDKAINIGHRVLVVFAKGSTVVGKVVYKAVATGDSWIIDSEVDGIVYAQNFWYIQKLNQGDR